MNINEKTLEKLKCDDCDSYLSFSPIMIKANGQNICGRCYVESDEEKLNKNIAYEALAMDMLFPCRYKEKGCKEKLPWNRAQFHEEGCEFQTYECPIAPIGNCEWKGRRSKLLKHFEKKHPNFILKHPCLIKPDIKQTTEQNFLISAHGFLFLLQTKCSVPAAKLCYCVRFLGYVNLAYLFEFTVDMKTSYDELKKSKVVATQENVTFEKDHFIEISINSLLGNLGDFKDISFTLTVNKILDEFKKVECFYCTSFINSSELKEQQNYCKNCTISNEIITVCKNKDFGCSYSDAPVNVRKHEKWFCISDSTSNQTTKCILCRLEKNKNNAINTYSHLNHKIIELDGLNKIYDASIEYSSSVIYDNTIFTCFWEIKNNVLEFKIISDIPKTENKIYTCTLVLYNPSNFKFVEKNLQFDNRSLEYDWIVKVENDYKQPFVQKRLASNNFCDSYGIELKIRRNDKFTNFWFLYDFPNMNKHYFRETPILSWKNVLVISCIKYFLNYAFSSELGPLKILKH